MRPQGIASAPDFEPVSAQDMTEANMGCLMVHVSGWNKGMKFIWMGTINGWHTLRTPKGGVYYRTRNVLLHLRHRTIRPHKVRIKLEDLL